MIAIVLDLETKVFRTGTGKHDIDGSPFNPHNRIVSAHWRMIDVDKIDEEWIETQLDENANEVINDHPAIGEARRSIYFHQQRDIADSRDDLQAALDSAEVLVAHNAKFDVTYLLEAGFRLPDRVWCTMIGEYIIARGTWVGISLKETAIRRDVTRKKDDLVSELFYSGIGYDEMDLDIVIEYGDGDVLTCAEIFLEQWNYFYRDPDSGKLINIVDLMNDMLMFLVEIERNGIAIDEDRLQEVRVEYETELAQLEKDLNAIVIDVMGDTPINLRSPDDITKVVYSREVIDRNLHKKVFNIGVDEYGNEQYPPFMSKSQFEEAVRTTTRRVPKRIAVHCILCKGKGAIRKIKKGGGYFKNETKCKHCGGGGFTYESTGKPAGLKLVPEGPRDASIGGFKAGSDELDRLIAQAQAKGNLQAVEFLTKKKRLNVVNVYLNSFVGGIQRWTRSDGILHPSFNQTVARTGRLSSSDPNFQNQPKGHKFPVRKSVRSRWHEDGGLIVEADFSGLEFVVAGELSRDKQIIEDILNKKDVHRQTGSIVHQKPKEEITKDERNAVKPYTFAPLYGGQGANEPPHIRAYFKEFFKIYSGHEEWQFNQMDAVIQTGKVVTPSGREYCFPGTRRLRGRRTTNATNIVNYPVQGFATGDIVPLACIRALRRFRELGLRSLLILTVHDSIVADVFPGELEAVVAALNWAMNEIPTEIEERWGYKMVLPLRSEVMAGPNWGELEEIH